LSQHVSHSNLDLFHLRPGQTRHTFAKGGGDNTAGRTRSRSRQSRHDVPGMKFS
jgi:hypothetical protein